MKRIVSPLDPATWDFTLCPDEEVRACLYYEVARDSEAVKHYRGSETFTNTPITSPALGTQYIAFFCPEFPDAPWLRLQKAARQCRLAEALLADTRWRGDGGLVVSNHSLSEFVGLFAEDLGVLAYADEGPVPTIGIRPMPEKASTWVALNLDWSKSRNTLVREFRELLNRVPGTFASKPTGRCNHRDLLNGLGAKRLRDHCKLHKIPQPLESALEVWQTHDSRDCPYSDSRAMRRAITRTTTLLKPEPGPLSASTEQKSLYRLVENEADPVVGTKNRAVLSIRVI